MYCVIQEIKLKKPNTHGAHREYEVSSINFTMNGEKITKYSYYPSDDAGRFERPHMEAYRVSLHQSYREGGKVKKRQYSIGTVGYYDLAEDFWPLYDLLGDGVQKAATASGQDCGTLYDLVESKVQELRDRVQKEFRKSEEYKADTAHKKLQKDYAKRKKAFADRYSVAQSEYDNVYDIFGNLKQPDYLDKLKRQRDAQQRSYYEQSRSNYNSWGSGYANYSSGYGVSEQRNYAEEDKIILKEFYKALSKKFHPDLNRDRDTTQQMQLLNRLKDEWKV